MSDPNALVVATAAAQALEFVGLPEAALNLAQATVYLSVAPKSNRVTQALGRARADLEVGSHTVPAHLRSGAYPKPGDMGKTADYRYPHDDPRGWVEQQYRPKGVEGHVYYEPSGHGEERSVAERMSEHKQNERQR
jgi:putative ATPase